MTIKKAIERLEEIRKKYGDAVKIFFDCPNCNNSFSPDKVVTIAIHLKENKNERS